MSARPSTSGPGEARWRPHGNEGVVDESILLLCRAYLSRVGEPGSYPLWRYIEDVGPVAAAKSIRHATAPPEVLGITAARRVSADAGADIEAAERHGARLVVPESDDWPYTAFAALARAARPTTGGVAALVPPTALWVRGTADLAQVRHARSRSSAPGLRSGLRLALTAEMCFGLASRGCGDRVGWCLRDRRCGAPRGLGGQRGRCDRPRRAVWTGPIRRRMPGSPRTGRRRTAS